MAIKIQNSTIIDDSRVVVNASKVGVGTTNPTPNLFVLERNRSDDADTDNWVASLNTANYESPSGVAFDSQGNLYLVGAGDTSSTGTFTYKGVIGKFNPSGNLIWQKNVTNSGITSGWTEIAGVAVDTSDNVYITGNQRNALISEKSIFTAKLNSSGTLQWQSHLGVGNSISGVNPNYIYSQHIGIGTTGDVFVVGVTSITGGRDALLVKYNNSGTLQWQKRFGVGINTNIVDESYSIGIGSTGIVYIGGQTGITTYKSWIAAVDSSGNIQWQRYYGDANQPYIMGIGVDSNENVYFGGHQNGSDSLYIVKLDKQGTLQWQKTFDSIDDTNFYEYYTTNIAFDSDNNLYFSGATYSASSVYPNTGDLALLKLNPSGDIVWQRSFGTSAYDELWFISPNNTAVKGNKVAFAMVSEPNGYDIPVASLTIDGDFIGNYGDTYKIAGLGFTVGIGSTVVGVSTLSINTSTLNTTAFDVSLENAGLSTSLNYRLPYYINPTAEIQGKLKVNIINAQDDDGNLGIGTTTPASKLSVAGTITEYKDYQYWNVVTEYDVGTEANQVPLNQYLGQAAFLDEIPYDIVGNTGNGFIVDGSPTISNSLTVSNNDTNIALDSDIIVSDGTTLRVSSGTSVVSNPFNFKTSSIPSLNVDTSLDVGISSTFIMVETGIGSIAPNSNTITGLGSASGPPTVYVNNGLSLVAVGQYVREIPGVISAGTTITSVGISTVGIYPPSINTSQTGNIKFTFGYYDRSSGITIDGRNNKITATGSNTRDNITIDGKENIIQLGKKLSLNGTDGNIRNYRNDIIVPQQGGIIQVVNTSTTSQVSIANTDIWTYTGLQGTIQPKNASSAILIFVSQSFYIYSPDSSNAGFTARVRRNTDEHTVSAFTQGTNTNYAYEQYINMSGSTSANLADRYNITCLDYPAPNFKLYDPSSSQNGLSVGVVTYTTEALLYQGVDTVTFQESGVFRSHMTLMEVVA